MLIYPYRYSYHKAPLPVNQVAVPHTASPRRPFLALIPPTLITLGSVLIANVLWPLLSYQLFTAPGLQRPPLISPVPLESLGSQPVQAAAAAPDYLNPESWFPTAPYDQGQLKPTTYTLSIPTLAIADALVVIGGHDLNQGLIQYPGTPDPGTSGSAIVFGHSVLRQFYNPAKTNPRRYLSIFSKIMTLKPGDRLYVSYNGNRYTYEVKDKYEVQPDDLSVLEQQYSNKLIKLITCVPEGTYLRRGIVVAQLMDQTGPGTTNVIHEEKL